MTLGDHDLLDRDELAWNKPSLDQLYAMLLKSETMQSALLMSAVERRSTTERSIECSQAMFTSASAAICSCRFYCDTLKPQSAIQIQWCTIDIFLL